MTTAEEPLGRVLMLQVRLPKIRLHPPLALRRFFQAQGGKLFTLRNDTHLPLPAPTEFMHMHLFEGVP